MQRSAVAAAVLSLAAALSGQAATAQETVSSQAAAGAPVEIRVDAAAGRRPISPYIYGRNGVDDDVALAKEAGLRISRESHGNNCTKYNWRNDLSSHPDWYNNVYKQGWHERAQRLQADFDDLQIMFCFQVLGWVAKTDEYNYDVPQENRPDVHLNLCAGGDPSLYLEPWTAKDTADILDHWFGPGGLGLDPARFRYWHMDNEPECWPGTHDDVCKGMSAEECVRRYVAVAREVKSRYPNIRLMAPGFTSEWFWWNWADHKFVDGKPWVEYFIMRMAEESRAFGRNLIDVVDFHTYAGADSDADALQEHRILYDPAYEYPRANGCRRYPGGEEGENRVEMILAHTEQWLDQYFGPGHGITIAVTETSAPSQNEMVRALWYASMLGTFADHGVEVFTPWEWYDSSWEVLHLFSRYAGTTRVEAASSDEAMVSAYASVNDDASLMTIILVNRRWDAARQARVTVAGFAPQAGAHRTLSLHDLPQGTRTFVSHTENALREGEVTVADGGVALTLPPYSITAMLLQAEPSAR